MDNYLISDNIVINLFYIKYYLFDANNIKSIKMSNINFIVDEMK